jgi:hypothetical protein
MDAAQFDAFARTLAGRLSRRTALRGAGLGAGLLAAAGIQPNRTALARQMTSTPYVVVRQYQPSASIADLQQALGQGYAPQLAQQPGFIDYTVFDNGSGVTSITVFDSQDDEEAATNQLASWVEQNLASLLPSPTETASGTSFVQVFNTALICEGGDQTPTIAAATATPAPTTAPTQAAPTATALPVCTDPSRPGVGCACSTGTQNPCGDTTLICCAEAGAAPGAPGVCTPSSVGCNPTNPTPAPTPCTDVGCPCTSGVEGTCADGLVCCQSQMGGGNNVPGGPGMCATPDGCGDGNGAAATPMG